MRATRTDDAIKAGGSVETAQQLPSYGPSGLCIAEIVLSILGHGIDLVDVEEIATLLTLSDDFLNRCFTDLERQRLAAISANPERVAARFAAKEAVLKALGKGFGNGFSFQDIEVLNLSSGAPYVVLHGPTRELSDSIGVSRWLVSLSHDGGKAIASVIAT